MPPGPGLSALLAAVDVAGVCADEAVAVLQAWSRQRAHDHAMFVQAMAVVARSSREATEAATAAQRPYLPVGDWAGAEIAAALTWTEGKTGRELEFAETLVERLPRVLAAFEAGSIDHGKAWTFADVLGSAQLADAQLEVLCAALVPEAPGWTTGQLRRRLLRAVLRVDAGYARRRYRRAVRRRGVCGYLAQDGTAVITADGLPADEAAAACARVDRLAGAVKRAGHPGTPAQIKADVFLRLLDGRLAGLSHPEIVDALLAVAAEADVTETDATGTEAAENGAGDAATAANGSAGTGAAESGAAESSTTESSTTESSTTESSTTESSTGGSGADDDAGAAGGAGLRPSGRPGGGARDTGSQGGDSGAAGVNSDGGCEHRRRSGVEIQVGLTTLLHHDERPGELPGWGPVPADVGRGLVARQHAAEWRFAIVDDEGYLLLAGVTRRRPRPAGPGAREARGGIVELQVPAAVLAELAAHPEQCGPWAGVVADLARQYADRDRLRADLTSRPEDRFIRAALRRHTGPGPHLCGTGMRTPRRRGRRRPHP